MSVRPFNDHNMCIFSSKQSSNVCKSAVRRDSSEKVKYIIQGTLNIFAKLINNSVQLFPISFFNA